MEEDDDIALDIPVKKRRKFANLDGAPEVLLTKHFRLDRDYGPAYTGGAFVVDKDARHAFAINDNKVSMIEISTGKVVGSIGDEGEDILTIALSPN